MQRPWLAVVVNDGFDSLGSCGTSTAASRPSEERSTDDGFRSSVCTLMPLPFPPSRDVKVGGESCLRGFEAIGGLTGPSCALFLFRPADFQTSEAGGWRSEASGDPSFSPVDAVWRSTLLRKAFNCALVSVLTASSLARVDSKTESRNATSSSSRERNWFLSRMDSSNASCFAAVGPNLGCQRVLRPTESTACSPLFCCKTS